MMTKLKINFSALVLALFAISCNNAGNSDDVSKPVVEESAENGKNQIDPLQEQKEAQEAIMPATTMSFTESEWDFGNIDEGDKVTHMFAFTNSGAEPLLIDNCKGSCGCTVPICPKEVIQPGESGQIEVSFNSQGKPGAQTKKVTITANTNPSQNFLTIKAMVAPKAPEAN